MTFREFPVPQRTIVWSLAETDVIMLRANGETPEKPRLADRWRNFRAAFRNLPRAFTLVWQTSPALTVTLAVFTLRNAVLPVSQA